MSPSTEPGSRYRFFFLFTFADWDGRFSFEHNWQHNWLWKQRIVMKIQLRWWWVILCKGETSFLTRSWQSFTNIYLYQSYLRSWRNFHQSYLCANIIITLALSHFIERREPILDPSDISSTNPLNIVLLSLVLGKDGGDLHGPARHLQEHSKSDEGRIFQAESCLLLQSLGGQKN